MSQTPSKPSVPGDLEFRYEVVPADRELVGAIVVSTGFFNAAEVDVAEELVDERLVKGALSGYHFVFIARQGKTLGYTCYGPIAGTAASYDLYWIAVHNDYRGQGLGRILLKESERLVAEALGQRVYIETSNHAHYEPTRAFYDRCGYRVEAILKDFYAPGDDKMILVKTLP